MQNIYTAMIEHRAAAIHSESSGDLVNAGQHYRSILTLCVLVREDEKNQVDAATYRICRTAAAEFIMKQDASREQSATFTTQRGISVTPMKSGDCYHIYPDSNDELERLLIHTEAPYRITIEKL